MNIFQVLKGIKNPKEEVLKKAKEINNPILNNMIDLANQNKTNELEQVARNIFKEIGIDFDKDIMPYIPKR